MRPPEQVKKYKKFLVKDSGDLWMNINLIELLTIILQRITNKYSSVDNKPQPTKMLVK